jgi:polynucleotide 5'-kinase involved in rRNA processing
MHDEPLATAHRAFPAQLDFEHPWLSEALVLGHPRRPPVEYPGWTRARADLLTQIAGGPGLLALLGPAGSGKTTLLHTLHADIQRSGRTAAIMSGDLLPFELAPG